MDKVFWFGVVLSVVTGILVNEFGETAPYVARRLIPPAARLWAGGDGDLRETLEEEWLALIADAPGKLNKLLQALLLYVGALTRAAHRRSRRPARVPLSLPSLHRVVASINYLFSLSAVIFGGLILSARVRDPYSYSYFDLEFAVDLVGGALMVICGSAAFLGCRQSVAAPRWRIIGFLAGAGAMSWSVWTLFAWYYDITACLFAGIALAQGLATVLQYLLRAPMDRDALSRVRRLRRLVLVLLPGLVATYPITSMFDYVPEELGFAYLVLLALVPMLVIFISYVRRRSVRQPTAGE